LHLTSADSESLENLAIDARYISPFGWNFLILQDNHEALTVLQEKLWTGAILCSFISVLILTLVGWNIRAYHLRMGKTAATDTLTSLINRQAFDFVFRSASTRQSALTTSNVCDLA